MTLQEFADLVGGELVGGRVLATLDGKKVYLSDVVDGSSFINDKGLEVQHNLELAAAALASKEDKPVRAKRVKAVDAADDLQIDITE